MPTLTPNSPKDTPVVVIKAPGELKRWLGKEGLLQKVDTRGSLAYAYVFFADELRGLPLAYLRHAKGDNTAARGKEGANTGIGEGGAVAAKKAVRKPRQPRLVMRTPKDTRSERERQNEAVAWIRGVGYRVHQTDTHRGRSICRVHRVPTRCPVKDCGKPGIVVDTGSDKGVSDLQIQHPRWHGTPIPTLCLDMKKGENAARTEEQEDRERRNELGFPWDCPSLAMAVVVFERSLGIVPLDEVLEKAGEK